MRIIQENIPEMKDTAHSPMNEYGPRYNKTPGTISYKRLKRKQTQSLYQRLENFFCKKPDDKGFIFFQDIQPLSKLPNLAVVV